jgi:hypothetical protein
MPAFLSPAPPGGLTWPSFRMYPIWFSKPGLKVPEQYAKIVERMKAKE